MAAQLTKNNAYGHVSSWTIGTGTGSFSLATGDGSRFPTISGGDWFFATLQDGNGNIEIVKVTARSGDTLTISSRAQEGTVAFTWTAGDLIEIRHTADTTVTVDGTQTLSNKTLTTLNVTGNSTLGDASGDTLTINAATWTIGNNFQETRTVGTAASGNSNIAVRQTSYSGHADGTSDVYSYHFASAVSGGNNVLNTVNVRSLVTWTGTVAATLGNARAYETSILHNGAGAITNASNYVGTIYVQNTGGYTNAFCYQVASPQITGAGTITLLRGLSIGNIGHAQVTSAEGIFVNNFTNSTNMRAFRSAVTAGTNKYGLYFDGDANNYIQGRVGIGAVGLTNTYLYVQDANANDTAVSEYATVSRIDALNTSGNVTKSGVFGYCVVGAAYGGTGTLSGVQGVSQLTGVITVAAMYGVTGSITNSAAGTVSVARAFAAFTPTNSGGGTVTTAEGYHCADITTAATNSFGFRGVVSAGTNKYNLYMDGTAQNYLAGGTFIGGIFGSSKLNINANDTTSGAGLARYTADANPPFLQFYKSRNATTGSHTVVQNGDQVGQISAWGSDGSAYRSSGDISFEIDGAVSGGGAADMPGRIVFKTTPDGSATPAESLRITSAGQVWQASATTIPAGGTTGLGYTFSSTSNFGVFFGSGAPSLSAAKGSLYLRSDGSGTTDRAYINTNGSTTWTALTTVA